MKNCAELKQTTVKKVISFSKCSIEFELRGATEKEFEEAQRIVSDVLNDPKYLDLKLKARKAEKTGKYDEVTEKDTELLAELNKKSLEATSQGDRTLLMTCLTPNKLYDAGFSVVKGNVEFENIDEVFSFMSKVDIEELEALALSISTLGNSEVAEEQVKPQ